MRPPLIAMLVTNDATHDVRVRKEARSAVEAGFGVVVIGCRSADAPEDGALAGPGAETVRVMRVADPLSGYGNPLARKIENLLGIRRIQRAIAAAALEVRPDVVHANDLDTLPAAIAIKRSTGARVVYDAHELYTELFDRPGAGFLERALVAVQKLVLRCQEARLIRQADAVVTVNPFIAAELARRYRVRTPSVVMNAPVAGVVEPLPLPDLARPILIYQGGLTRGRGLPELLEAFALTERGSLVLMGGGPLAAALSERAARPDLRGRVAVLDPVPTSDVVRAAASADIGLIPYLPGSLNNRLSSPNKLFDYLHAGLAIVATDLPFIADVLSRTGAGAVYDPYSTDSMVRTIRSVADDAPRREAMRSAARAAAADYTWEGEVTHLIGAYRQLTGEVGSGCAGSQGS